MSRTFRNIKNKPSKYSTIPNEKDEVKFVFYIKELQWGKQWFVPDDEELERNLFRLYCDNDKYSFTYYRKLCNTKYRSEMKKELHNFLRKEDYEVHHHPNRKIGNNYWD
ncbi:MAG: hypothetical protein M0R77_00175 [Gammaproteobacteria bacterium]|nr:hypothetical protein [Acholeplasmataceae bacterium]MCK9528970.1 hypothetical protein [Gammaproteobacteria bacterium]